MRQERGCNTGSSPQDHATVPGVSFLVGASCPVSLAPQLVEARRRLRQLQPSAEWQV